MRPDGCLSDFLLDQLVRNELDDATARAHAGSCERCGARLQSIEDSRAAFVAAMPRLRLPAPTPRSPRWWQLGWMLVPAAAALLIFILRPHTDDGVRTKGGFALGFYVKHGDSVRLAEPNETVTSGDALRFFYTASKAARFGVVSVDPAGHASAYYPSGDHMQSIEATQKQLLDDSIVLDSSVGVEQIYGVFCANDHALADVVHDIGARHSPDDCHVLLYTIHKRSP